MKLFKKLFGKSDDEDVELTFDTFDFTPKEDITAYELSQYLLLKRSFVFKGDLQKLQNDIMEWHYSLSPSLARHFTLTKRTITVSRDLLKYNRSTHFHTN